VRLKGSHLNFKKTSQTMKKKIPNTISIGSPQSEELTTLYFDISQVRSPQSHLADN
jgi:hypothetical protein